MTRDAQARVTVWCLIGAVLVLALAIVTSGCKRESICNSIEPGDSVLCDIAAENDLHLETVGQLIMVANLRAIKEGAYTKEEAVEVLQEIKDVLIFQVSAQTLHNMAAQYVVDYPELLLLSPYVGELDTPRLLTDADRKLLTTWIDGQIDLLQ